MREKLHQVNSLKCGKPTKFLFTPEVIIVFITSVNHLCYGQYCLCSQHTVNAHEGKNQNQPYSQHKNTVNPDKLLTTTLIKTLN